MLVGPFKSPETNNKKMKATFQCQGIIWNTPPSLSLVSSSTIPKILLDPSLLSYSLSPQSQYRHTPLSSHHHLLCGFAKATNLGSSIPSLSLSIPQITLP